eukprot:2130246-Prymnesium_polylepis.1
MSNIYQLERGYLWARVSSFTVSKTRRSLDLGRQLCRASVSPDTASQSPAPRPAPCEKLMSSSRRAAGSGSSSEAAQ